MVIRDIPQRRAMSSIVDRRRPKSSNWPRAASRMRSVTSSVPAPGSRSSAVRSKSMAIGSLSPHGRCSRHDEPYAPFGPEPHAQHLGLDTSMQEMYLMFQRRRGVRDDRVRRPRPYTCCGHRGHRVAGIGMAIALKKAGVRNFVILEKADRVGGTWRENTYPGCACDIRSHLYSFSFEPKADWTREFAPQAEILAYIEHCVAKYGLQPHIRFGQEVTGAEYDEATAAWDIATVQGDTITSKALVIGQGPLHVPNIPELPGLERFEGQAFHSAQWDHEYDLTGKRIAVIGTGASA